MKEENNFVNDFTKINQALKNNVSMDLSKLKLPDLADNIQDIGKNAKNISDDVSTINEKIASLESTVVSLRLELDVERQKVKETEKKNKVFSISVAILGAVVSCVLPLIINCIRSIMK